MSDINHAAAKVQAELFAKNPQGYFTWETVNYGLAYLDLAAQLESANANAEELLSRLDTVTASHCEMLRELQAERQRVDRLTRSVEHNCDVLSPLFQCGGKYADIGVIGEPLINSVPRLIEKLETENAELRARLEDRT